MVCFETSLKVRTYECDSYGHVNHATFLNYCEYARVEFLQVLGFDLQGLLKMGFLLPIVKIEIEYKKPVFPNEELRLTIEWLSVGKTSAVFQQMIYRNQGSQPVVQAKVTWVATDLKGKPVQIPEALIKSYHAKTGLLPPQKANNGLHP